jgi:hypothetical protein
MPNATARAAKNVSGGGEFSGAGSSGRWEESSSSESLVELPEVSLPSADAADEFAIPLAVILAVLSVMFVLLFASISVALIYRSA